MYPLPFAVVQTIAHTMPLTRRIQMRKLSLPICSVVVLLALALTGCSGNDSSTFLEQPTRAPAPTQAAVAPAQPTAGRAAQPVSQQATPLPAGVQSQLDAEEQIVGNVFDHVGPAVVRIETDQGLGSGYLIDKDGHIVTNNHVIADSQNGQVLVSFSGLFQTIGKVIGADPDSDIAVVQAQE